MNVMRYKGYFAKIEYSDEDECFIGRVQGINDIITFHGESIAELHKEFNESIDFYLETCRERGEEPNKPYSGNLMLRIAPGLHAEVAMTAKLQGKSINQWTSQILEEALH